jgi:hypothetical protein
MTAITGNTYPVKDQIKALGGRWNPDEKAWMVPDAKADEARNLVANPSTSTASKSSSSYRPHKCVVCSTVSRQNSRGYWEPKILRSGECVDCYEERKMGY